MKEGIHKMRCTYCGRIKDLDEDICECGKVGYVVDDNDMGFYWGELNNIDNLLENKRNR